jgi:uncharacterized protein (DUF2062 family)
MNQYVNSILRKLIKAETSVSKLAWSFSFGGFLAFSPYLGLQTWLTFPFCWLFGLNVTVTLASLYLISNPITMVPIILAGYGFGRFLLIDIGRFNILAYNPEWLDSMVKFLAKYVVDLEKLFGAKICFWCYVIGAHILGFIVALALYPVMKKIFSKLMIEDKIEDNNENNYAK